LLLLHPDLDLTIRSTNPGLFSSTVLHLAVAANDYDNLYALLQFKGKNGIEIGLKDKVRVVFLMSFCLRMGKMLLILQRK